MHRTPARRLLVVALFLGMTAAAVELGSRAGLVLLERRGIEYRPLVVDRLSAKHRELLEDLLAGRPSLFQHDAVLGWTLRPGFRSELSTVDVDGRRRDPERPQPVAPAVRVATFGDSFTFGGDVADRDAYPEVLARLDAGLSVENFGVPAYGLDQAFLRYQREGRPAHPQIVVIGFMSENIFRNVSVFRPFYMPLSQVPLAKPRYLPGLPGRPDPILVGNPLPLLADYRRLLARPAETLALLGRHDYFYRTRLRARAFDGSAAVRLAKLAREHLSPDTGIVRRGYYNTDGEAFRVTTGLFTSFYEMALRDGAQPVILIFPERGDLDRWRSTHTKRYTPLLKFLATKRYRVVDAMTALDAAANDHPVDDLIPGHFSPLANQLVAEYLLEQLRGFGLVSPRPSR
ncbi:MAG: hypothetical protein ABJC13_18320 [Acidobacteriota bacterium]